MAERWTRRQVLGGSLRAGAVLAAGRFSVTELIAQSAAADRTVEPAFGALDSFVHDYLRAMDAPGMTLVIANRNGIVRAVAYGFSDLERPSPVNVNQLFEIGSISKSFVAIAVLQLADEKKIDLHRPIAEFMPWLKVESRFAPITVHHLLTHTSGLPERLNCLLTDPDAAFRVRYAPGEHFSYCNLAYQALGYLLWQADGRPFADVIRQRILLPLKMDSTEPVIAGDVRLREARSYNPFVDDRPLIVGGRLKPAPPLVMDNAAGCISSTPHDMGRYIQMLANRGTVDGTRVLSDNTFALMTRPHTKAEAFGPTASYGYGLAVDTFEGHTILRHTGGMVSFASSMQIDLDEGVGAFASINAMQGFRPNPVTQFALQLMRAVNQKRSLPKPPAVDPRAVPDAADFAGRFTSPTGASLEIVVDGSALTMVRDGKRFPIDLTADGRLIVRGPKLDIWPLNFLREKGEGTAVTDLVHGPDWYFNARYTGPRAFTYPPAWESFAGHYRNDSPWYGSLRVVKAKGQLWLDGVVPLQADGDAAFWLNDPPYNPGRIEFLTRIGAACMHVRLSGEDFWRVMVP